ncbi:MAG: DUF192 domain-containing protein [Halobacteriales archaeon SW_9_67_25]|jgi:uncharacterized membrane protein (UPF0127 family)|nr:MAG: DUF192 domain-containing protein [Halobacteriales archaeon SW_9_67_25]
MNRRQAVVLGTALLGAAALAVLLTVPPLALVDADEYETTTVTVYDENETRLATVDVRIADTREKRRIGLMRTDSLESGAGMLFVHARDGTYTYHMRNVSFDIDIVFVGADGTVTTVHHASAPDPGEDSETYTGRGKYVLEVPRGYTNATGIDVGDSVEIPEAVA